MVLAIVFALRRRPRSRRSRRASCRCCRSCSPAASARTAPAVRDRRRARATFRVFDRSSPTWLLDRLGLPEDCCATSRSRSCSSSRRAVVPQVGVAARAASSALSRRPAGDLGGGFLLGCALGLVLVPCAGRCSARSRSSRRAATSGSKTLVADARVRARRSPSAARDRPRRPARRATRFRARVEPFRRVFGVVVAAAALALVFDVDRQLRRGCPATPRSPEPHRAERRRSAKPAKLTGAKRRGPLATRGRHARRLRAAPDFTGIADWLNNRQPLTLAAAARQGRARRLLDVLVHQLPAHAAPPRGWDARVPQGGLVVVGVHTPEFAFEHDARTSAARCSDLGVRYPVALDNDYGTWNAYGNQYWPAKYLIDRRGPVRYAHFGEGELRPDRELIRTLLGEKAATRRGRRRLRDLTPTRPLTPETYLGWSGSPATPARRSSRTAERLLVPGGRSAQDELAYAGDWRSRTADRRRRRTRGCGSTSYARKVYLVLGGHGTRAGAGGRQAASGTVHGHAGPALHAVDRSAIDDALLELRFSPGVDGLRLHVRLAVPARSAATTTASLDCRCRPVAALLVALPQEARELRGQRLARGMSASSISSARRSSSST